jgi:DNA-binding MarR family transcriptional regulator
MAGHMNIILAEAGHDVTIEQWIVLTVLADENGQCQQKLADIIGIDKTSMTRMLDGLQKRNLIRRASDKKDLRFKKIFITPVGRKLHLSVIPLVEKNQAEVTENIPAADLAICLRVLKLIYENTKHESNCT